jgi:nucleotide-binding universal stress UspA family protein
MFKHILVPLDGSHMAETVLPTVTMLAMAVKAKVTLLHVIELHAPDEIHGEHHIKTEDEACNYLDNVAEPLRKQGIETRTHVHSSCVEDVAESLVEHSGEFDHDLIVLCSHGESHWKDRIVGSLAQQVIGLGKLPVLLMHPECTADTEFSGRLFRRFLLALDGREEHETGVERSVELASALHADLHLLTVINTLSTLSGAEAATGMLLPSATTLMLEIAEEDAMERLDEKAEALRKQGFNVSLDVHRGDPVEWIVKDSETHSCDLIVLGTHGRRGMNAFWAGSSAPRVPGMTKKPLLLIPVHEN